MRISQLVLSLALSTAVLVGCDSGGSNGDDGLAGGGSLSATVAGASFTATVVTATSTGGVLSIGGNLGASSSVQEQINLTVMNAAVGTNQIGIGGSVAVYSKGSSVSDIQAYAATSGSISITEMTSSSAKGTFQFTGRANGGQTVSVSNGQFDVTF